MRSVSVARSEQTKGTTATVLRAPVLRGLRTGTISTDRWETRKACPICEEGDTLLVAAVEGSDRGAELAACVRCELVFLRRRPEQAWLDEYYLADWDTDGRDVRVRARPEVYEFCEPVLRSRSRVLDAGAGYGGALLPFAELGHDVQALDASRQRAEFVEHTLCLPSRVGRIEDSRFDSPFDLVLSRHMLEHVREPASALAAMRQALAPGGALYLALPNLWYEPAPQSVHYVPHHSLFTEHALRRLLGQVGFEVVRFSAEHELRVLARRAEEVPRAGTAHTGSNSFLNDIGRWIAAGFGPGRGRRLVAWWKPRDRPRSYDGYTVSWMPYGARAAFAYASAVHNAGGLRRARRVPRLADTLPPPGARLLPVQVVAGGLPLVVRYERTEPPVWLK